MKLRIKYNIHSTNKTSLLQVPYGILHMQLLPFSLYYGARPHYKKLKHYAFYYHDNISANQNSNHYRMSNRHVSIISNINFMKLCSLICIHGALL